MGSVRSAYRSYATDDTRARAWAYVFDCYRKKEAATSPVSRPDDRKGLKNDPARLKYT